MLPLQIISISALFVACKVHDRARSADTFVRAAWDVLCTAALKSDMEKNKELARLNDPVRTCRAAGAEPMKARELLQLPKHAYRTS